MSFIGIRSIIISDSDYCDDLPQETIAPSPCNIFGDVDLDNIKLNHDNVRIPTEPDSIIDNFYYSDNVFNNENSGVDAEAADCSEAHSEVNERNGGDVDSVERREPSAVVNGVESGSWILSNSGSQNIKREKLSVEQLHTGNDYDDSITKEHRQFQSDTRTPKLMKLSNFGCDAVQKFLDSLVSADDRLQRSSLPKGKFASL